MADVCFSTPPPDQMPAGAVQQAYMAGIEGVPWRSRNSWSDGILWIERDTHESGHLYIPWDVPDEGTRVLSTCTLVARESPYCLATELARGTLHRARDLIALMHSDDVEVPRETERLLTEGLASLFQAVTHSASAAEDAARAIGQAIAVMRSLCHHFGCAALVRRHRKQGNLPMLLGGRFQQVQPACEPRFLEAFNAAVVPFCWRDLQPDDDHIDWKLCEAQVAWCHQHQLQLIGGPLVQLDSLSLPDWVFLWEQDYDTFENHVIQYIDRVVRRFDNEVDIWNCAGRLNLGGSMALSEEERLRLAVAAIEAVRRASPRTPVVVGFDQPWAEYLAANDDTLSPLHFADALVRADLGVAGIGIEINLGYWPGGSLPRDLLEVTQHIDRWSLLGIPLVVYLTTPSQATPDPHATGRSEVIPRDRKSPLKPAIDHAFAAELVPLLLTRPMLHAVIWNQWDEASTHVFPHSGLIDANGTVKPLVESLARVRKEHLG